MATAKTLQADNFKNRQKTNETIFVYQSTGERRTLESEGFGIEYTIREYDSIPGPNAGERPVEDHATTNEQPSHDLGKDAQTQSFDER